MSELRFKHELRVTVEDVTPSGAVAKAEAALEAEGCEVSWLTVNKRHAHGTWEATISGIRPDAGRAASPGAEK